MITWCWLSKCVWLMRPMQLLSLFLYMYCFWGVLWVVLLWYVGPIIFEVDDDVPARREPKPKPPRWRNEAWWVLLRYWLLKWGCKVFVDDVGNAEEDVFGGSGGCCCCCCWDVDGSFCGVGWKYVRWRIGSADIGRYGKRCKGLLFGNVGFFCFFWFQIFAHTKYERTFVNKNVVDKK